jgi:hypothetical protein
MDLGNSDATAGISGMRPMGRLNNLKSQFIVYDFLQWNVCGAGIRKQHKQGWFVFI